MGDTIVSVVFVAIGVLFVAMAVPLIRRKIRPNRLYGFRTPSTLNDERIWYEVNATTGVDLLATGVGLLIVNVAHALGLFSARAVVVVSALWLTVGALWSLVHGFAVINRMKQTQERR
jgi:uncharacterized membrane protein